MRAGAEFVAACLRSADDRRLPAQCQERELGAAGVRFRDEVGEMSPMAQSSFRADGAVGCQRAAAEPGDSGTVTPVRDDSCTVVDRAEPIAPLSTSGSK